MSVKSEAIVLDHHVAGYFEHGVVLNDGDTVFDVGANIGAFGIRAVQQHAAVRVFAFEPVPEIFKTFERNSKRFWRRTVDSSSIRRFGQT